MNNCLNCQHRHLLGTASTCRPCLSDPNPNNFPNWEPIMANIHECDYTAKPKRVVPSIVIPPMPATVAGRKDDNGKLDMNLLDDMPRAVKALVEVMQWAVTKKLPVPYERGSWQGVEADRYRAAQGRHNVAQAEQVLSNGLAPRFQRDHETGLLHEAHKACSAMMALENILRELEATRNE